VHGHLNSRAGREKVSPDVPLSAEVRERCRAFLPPGEEIHYAFPASSTVIPVGVALAHFIVVVTETTVTVLSTGMCTRDVPQSVWARYPRTTRIGPVDRSLDPEFVLGDMVMWVDEEYLPVIAAADAEITAPDFPPPHLLHGE
jgi:hypothetical protein